MPLDKRTCQSIANADRLAWDDFVQMFSEWTAEVTDAVTEAPEHEVRVAQGRAQQCKFLLRFFKEIDLP